MSTSTPLWSDSQVLARSLLSCISGSLSVLGSLGIIYLIASDWKKEISKLRNRILFGLSIFDIILSAALAVATLPVPEGTPYAAWAIGNSATCTFQGFFIQFGLAAFLYNASLAIYHLLVVHYQKQDRWIKQNIERYLHIVPISFCFITAIISTALDLFHYSGNICHLASYPHQCHVQDNVPCLKGQNITVYRIIFAILPLLLAFVTVIICMGFVVMDVYKMEKKSKKYDFELRMKRQLKKEHRVQNHNRMSLPAMQTTDMKRTREAFVQALLYSGSFFIVIIFVMIALIIESSDENGYVPFVLTCLNYFFRPLQGVFNFFIFIRPYYEKKKRQKRRNISTDEGGSLPNV